MWTEWAEASVRDMEEIYQYRKEFGEEHADVVVGQIIAATELLLSFPLSGRQGRLFGTRELVVKNLPYLIHYNVDGERIFILRVRHTAREPLQ